MVSVLLKHNQEPPHTKQQQKKKKKKKKKKNPQQWKTLRQYPSIVVFRRFELK